MSGAHTGWGQAENLYIASAEVFNHAVQVRIGDSNFRLFIFEFSVATAG